MRDGKIRFGNRSFSHDGSNRERDRGGGEGDLEDQSGPAVSLAINFDA